MCLIASVNCLERGLDAEVLRLLTPLAQFAERVRDSSGLMLLVFPATCPWQDERMVVIKDVLKLTYSDVDLCALGVVADKGRHAGRPYQAKLRVAANLPELHVLLESCVCPGAVEHPAHSSGKAAVTDSGDMAGGIPKQLAEHIHSAFANWRQGKIHRTIAGRVAAGGAVRFSAAYTLSLVSSPSMMRRRRRWLTSAKKPWTQA